MAEQKNILDTVSLWLVIIGGINWGLVGVLKLDLVETIFGSIAILQQIIYIVIGLAALYMVYGTLMKK
ncbi:DUF378 domain-containing protein [Candidatus Woesearchaeota archaeon]|nr:DUF378 domain-containing protein [Candidatus Woesearchaeota archaeon]